MCTVSGCQKPSDLGSFTAGVHEPVLKPRAKKNHCGSFTAGVHDARRKATVAASRPEWGSIRGSDDDEDGNADGDKLEEAVNMDYNWEPFLVN